MKRRTFLKILGAGVGFVVLATAAGFATAFVAKFSIEHQLHVMGWPEARVDYLELTPTGLIIDHIALDQDDFSGIDTIEASISLPDLLLRGKIDRVKIKEITLSGEFDEAGQLKIAGWDATMPDMAADGGGGISSLLLQGVTFDVETSEGSLRFEGKAALSASTKIEGQRDIQFSLWGRQKQLSFAANGSGKISAEGQWQLHAVCEEGRVDMADVKVSRAAGQLDASGTAGQAASLLGKMVVGSATYGDASFQNVNMLLDTRQKDIFTFETSPTGFPDVVFFGKIAEGEPRLASFHAKGDKLAHIFGFFGDEAVHNMPLLVNKEASWSAALSLPLGDILAPQKNIDWTIGLAVSGTGFSASGKAVLDASHVKVSLPQELPIKASNLSTFLPFVTRAGFRFTGGEIIAGGGFTLPLASDDGEKPQEISSSHFRLKPTGLEGTWKGVAFRDLQGGITLASVSPLRFAGEQTQIFTLVGTEGDIGSGRVSFFSSPKGDISVTQAQLDMAQGSAALSPFVWDMAQGKALTVVTLKNLDLQKLVELGGAEGFSASGTLGGNVPVEITSGGVVFKNGVVRSEGENGHFAYVPAAYPSSLSGDDVRMNTLREALKDFGYTSLILTLDGPLMGKMSASLQASGRNPVFERPLELNINLSGDIGPVLQTALGLQPLPQ
ncbi:MAG: YdbH domain-containing protein [Pseudobdellovibrionaceae bacterium]